MDKAKRGDLVALVDVGSYTIQAGGRFGTVRTERVTLGEVTSVSRDGVVKAWRDLAYADGVPTKRERFTGQLLMIPRDKVRAAVVVDAYRARRYATAPDSTQVPPFESTNELRAWLGDIGAMVGQGV